jgi:DNA-directed RNA polymerase III subunit RPC2
MNKASLDRGFGRITYLRRYGTEIEKYTNLTADRIVAPAKYETDKKRKAQFNQKYHALDVDGLPNIGEKLSNNDIYINKETPLNAHDKIA